MPDKVYLTRVIPQPGVEMLREHASVDVNEFDEQLSHEELCRKAGEYDALVTLLTDRIDQAVLEAGKGRLKVVANVAVGYDNIDVPAATDNGIMVTNTPGVLTDTTADFAWSLLMSIARRVPEGDAFLRAGSFQGWGIMMLLGGDVFGKTLGVVGFGRIGQAVARRARGFDMKILYYDPVPEAEDAARDLGAQRVGLETLLRNSDFVSVHTPLTAETHHLLGPDQFRLMKQTAYLVNTSRGPIIDEHALAQALRDGEIAGAALDVYENEPQVEADLLPLANVILTPHIASASVDTRARMAAVAAENVVAALDDRRPPALLNPEVLLQ